MEKKENILIRLNEAISIIRGKRKEIKTENPIPNKKSVVIPAGRISSPRNNETSYSLDKIKKETDVIKPEFSFEAIPIIRKLYKYNEDVGSILVDLIQLTNTGHKIKFDNSVAPDLVDKMRSHIETRSNDWGSGVSGIHGIINKLIAQIWVGGALSAEIVPSRDFMNVDNIIIIDPETIRFKLNKKDGRYNPYQLLKYFFGFDKQYIKLNTNTYKYYGLIGDTDNPYGVPPFMTALKSLSTQKAMRDNIDHIMNQMGLLGYLEVLAEKPEQQADESDETYKSRLTSFLTDTKNNVLHGFKQGVVAGYEGDHTFTFHSTTKNLNGIPELFNQNENQIANGLKSSSTFLGVSGGGTEQMLSIVFTKMLSQLKNVQLILATFLEELYKLELLMAGYNFKNLKVEFKASTITDDLKIQQGREIKQRVLHNLWVDGIIGQEVYADSMDYQKPDRVVVPPEPNSNTDSSGKKKKEDDKDTSDRKGRDKKKNQPKRKDTETKKR